MTHLLQTHNVHIEHNRISAGAWLSDELPGLDCLHFQNGKCICQGKVSTQIQKEQHRRMRFDQKYLAVLTSVGSAIMFKNMIPVKILPRRVKNNNN